MSASRPNGLSVPDASMHHVNSVSDVLELLQIGQANRAMCATALNQRSSRSHSVITIHVQGIDLITGDTRHGSLHLVDLAGSERVGRSEVAGDRLKEAQYINKSLSALGDVIFALSQKNAHVPYRNSKLTQVLQSSLGGHGKAVMFVQISPDAKSYSETISTLKFAKRVSGVELGVARSNKERNDVKELMEKVEILKETVAKKDEKIEYLKMLMDGVTPSLGFKPERQREKLLSHASASGLPSKGLATRQGLKLSKQNVTTSYSKVTSDSDYSEYYNRNSFIPSKQPVDEKLKSEGTDQSYDSEFLCLSWVDSEKTFSDLDTDGELLEADCSASDGIDLSLFPVQEKSIYSTKEEINKVTSGVAKQSQQKVAQVALVRSKLKDSLASPRRPVRKDALKPNNSNVVINSPRTRKNYSQAASSVKPLSKRWH
ncbi:hypothetical protein HPP92_008519 [Vanilla planifolia]|uniref:Kinesin-like protein n=1 Tax=Vanilla planifolia TaxID=51239 RepID=A0A835R8I0_VANPL|nr:hypothetical protein HPP92_008519 [Vanilla planifolia]